MNNFLRRPTIIIFLLFTIFQVELLTAQSKKPPRKTYRRVRKSGAIRSGQTCITDNTRITLIVPKGDYNSQADILKSSLDRPSFAWYLSGSSTYSIKFTLVAPDGTYIKELPFKKGLNIFQLPDDFPALEVGTITRWTVSILCDRQRPSRNPFAQDWISRANLPPELDTNITCNTYGDTGFWYDALDCYLKKYPPSYLINCFVFTEQKAPLGSCPLPYLPNRFLPRESEATGI